MKKSDYKKVKSKSSDIQDRLLHKGVYCISNKWIAWAKKYLNRSQRRKNKQEVYFDYADYEMTEDNMSTHKNFSYMNRGENQQ